MREIGEAPEQIGLVPVITIKRQEDAASLAQMPLAGGVECTWITFWTAAAEESIRRFAQAAPRYTGWCGHRPDEATGRKGS